MDGDQGFASLHIRLRALVARLDALQRRFERLHDPRAAFTLVYRIITVSIDARLEGMGLADPGWLVRLAERFACRYFMAVEAADDGRSPGRVWEAVFAAIGSRSSVLEDIVFPMTAHIVHDLPLALLDAGFDEPGLASRLHDYDRVNQVMEESIDHIRQHVTRRYSPGLRFLDRMERHYDLVLSGYGIRMSRGQAWYDALRLRDPSLAEVASHSLESRPIDLIDSVRHAPASTIGLVLSMLRRVSALFRRWPSQEDADPWPGS